MPSRVDTCEYRRVDLGAFVDEMARFVARVELRLGRVWNAAVPWTIAATALWLPASLERCFVLLGDAYRYEHTDPRACLVLATPFGLMLPIPGSTHRRV